MTEWLEQLRRLDGVVTPGEWSACTDATGDTFIASLTDSAETVCEFGAMSDDDDQARLEADAYLIALLGSESTRAAILAMADRVKALEADVGRLREANGILEDGLQEVGDDYPGSSCQQWCLHQIAQARAALTGGEDAAD